MSSPSETINCLLYQVVILHVMLNGTQPSGLPWAALFTQKAMHLVDESAIFTPKYKRGQSQVLITIGHMGPRVMSLCLPESQLSHQ